MDKRASEEIAREALLALGNAGTPDALPPLQKALADQSATLREAAAKALGQNGSPEADKLLQGALKDSDEHVRQAAKDALASRKKN